MEDPNYEQTDIFAFMMEKPAGKKPKARAKKAAPSSEKKRAKAAVSEEASLFGEKMAEEKKPARGKKVSPKKAAPFAKAKTLTAKYVAAKAGSSCLAAV